MRIKNLFIGDVRFQRKYGFYMLYIIFTIIYIGVTYALPVSLREKASTFFIFTDPAALGLFFMGSIVLLEKSERVLNTLAVSPVTTSEYILSKLLSLGFISTISGSVIAFSTGKSTNILYFTIGLFLGSCLFSLFGLIIAAKTKSLNSFIISTMPYLIIMTIPAALHIFGYSSSLLFIHPGIIIIDLLSGSNTSILLIFLLIFWVSIFYKIAHVLVDKMIKSIGGVKL